MKQISVSLPQKVFKRIKELKEEGIVPSLSEYCRNAVIQSFLTPKRTVSVERTRFKAEMSLSDVKEVESEGDGTDRPELDNVLDDTIVVAESPT